MRTKAKRWKVFPAYVEIPIPEGCSCGLELVITQFLGPKDRPEEKWKWGHNPHCALMDRATPYEAPGGNEY